MKSVLYLVLAIKCLGLSNTEEIQDVKDNSKIVGGFQVQHYSHPYMVSLQSRLLFVRMHVCGGALLNKFYILTAAHCGADTWLIKWLPMDAVAGTHHVRRYSSPAQIIQIKDRIPHPLFKGGIGPHDIALYKTIAPFRFTSAVQPIRLSSSLKIQLKESSLKLVGWGDLSTTYFLPDTPDNLQEADVKPMLFKDCYYVIEKMKAPYQENPLDPYANFCTGSKNSRITGCTGDSGGPVVQINTIIPSPNELIQVNYSSSDCLNNKCSSGDVQGKPDPRKHTNNKEVVLLGIVSWGVSECGTLGAPTIYTNVSNYMDFINFSMNY